MDHALLFARGALRAVLEATAKKVTDRLQGWDPDALLATPEIDVVEKLIDDGSVRCPRLLRDQAWMPPPSEVT